jgi:hypothetical protein
MKPRTTLQNAGIRVQSGLTGLTVCLVVAFGMCLAVGTNSPSATSPAPKASTDPEVLLKRAEQAAERAEAAAKRAEAAARRAEEVENRAKEGNSVQDADALMDAQVRASIPEDEELRLVAFMVGKKYFDFNIVDRQARVWLTKDGHAPPTNLPAEFDVSDEKVFVAVKYGTEVGKRFWYVKFNKDMEVEEWGTRIRQESDG